MTGDETVGWHHLLDGHEFEQALGVGTLQLGCMGFSLERLPLFWSQPYLSLQMRSLQGGTPQQGLLEGLQDPR